MGVDVSVIVPRSDHGTPGPLIGAFERQTLPADRWELIVADPNRRAVGDGGNGRVRHLLTPAVAGRAGALNRGIAAAEGELVVLLADDFVPVPEFLAEHVALHDADPRAEVVGVGPGLFPDDVRSDPFARWLEDSGRLFGFAFTDPGAELPPHFFYAGNASLKRAFLLGDRLFDERFPDEAIDDFELGKRLRARGMEARLVRGARAWHHHRLDLAERMRVMRTAGCAAATFDAIYPVPHPWNTRIDDCEPTLLMWVEAQRGRLRHLVWRDEAARERYFERMLRRAFVQGYRAAAWRR